MSSRSSAACAAVPPVRPNVPFGRGGRIIAGRRPSGSCVAPQSFQGVALRCPDREGDTTVSRADRGPAAPAFGPAPTKGDEVFEALREDIVTGAVPANEILSESALCERFGTSRSPVRYALARAVEAGLVAVKARQGYVVRGLTLEDAQEVLLLRSLLEGVAVELACRGMSLADVEDLRVLALRTGVAVADVDVRQLARYDKRFHLAIAKASGVYRLERFVSQLLDDMLRFPALLTEPSQRAAVRDRHLAIVEAIAARDPARARAALASDLEATRERLAGPALLGGA